MDYQSVQQIAKDTIYYISQIIKPGMSLLDVRKVCEDRMFELGADSFWYWDVGSTILFGFWHIGYMETVIWKISLFFQELNVLEIMVWTAITGMLFSVVIVFFRYKNRAYIQVYYFINLSILLEDNTFLFRYFIISTLLIEY